MARVVSRALAAVITAALGVAACSAAPVEADADEAAATGSGGPADPKASAPTRTVLANLRAFDFASADPFDHRIVLGQQDADTSNRAAIDMQSFASDVQSLAGRPPALVSYEVSQAYRGATTMFDPAAFAEGRGALRELVLDKHARGVLVSLVWHMRCPKASASLPDKYAPSECPRDYALEELLEQKPDGSRGAHFAEWRAMLDAFAELLWSLKDARGELVPVQIRPFHEHTGGWFWWGRQNGAEAYRAAWREMVTYLRDGRGLHNALWVYSPAAPSDRAMRDAGGRFEDFYPGDRYVDVIAFDRYDHGDGSFAAGYAGDLREVGAFARAHGKVAAVAEVGRDQSRLAADPDWFTRDMLEPLRGRAFAYVALWRNAPWEKFVPEPGDGPVARDFTAMARDGAVLLAGAHDLYRPLHVGP
jgi:hypothetical protein